MGTVTRTERAQLFEMEEELGARETAAWVEQLKEEQD